MNTHDDPESVEQTGADANGLPPVGDIKLSKSKGTYNTYKMELSYGQLEAIRSALEKDHADPISDELLAILTYYLDKVPGPGEEEEDQKMREQHPADAADEDSDYPIPMPPNEGTEPEGEQEPPPPPPSGAEPDEFGGEEPEGGHHVPEPGYGDEFEENADHHLAAPPRE